jgi:hypothetical protein
MMAFTDGGGCVVMFTTRAMISVSTSLTNLSFQADENGRIDFQFDPAKWRDTIDHRTERKAWSGAAGDGIDPHCGSQWTDAPAPHGRACEFPFLSVSPLPVVLCIVGMLTFLPSRREYMLRGRPCRSTLDVPQTLFKRESNVELVWLEA